MNPKLRDQLFLFYPIHLGSILGLFFVDYTLSYLFLFLLGWILIHGYGVELGLHRYFSHRAFKLKEILIIPLLYLSTLAIQGPVLGWASIHRRHHQYSDRELDPHSPRKGKWYAWHQWTNNWLDDNINGSIKNVKDLVKKKEIKFFTKNYFYIILITYLVVGFIDLNAVYWFLMLPATLGLVQSYNVNLFCHIKKLGYRNVETKDDSTNIFLLSVTTWGLGLHNNHHAKPESSNLEMNNKEFDLAARLLLPFIKK